MKRRLAQMPVSSLDLAAVKPLGLRVGAANTRSLKAIARTISDDLDIDRTVNADAVAVAVSCGKYDRRPLTLPPV